MVDILLLFEAIAASPSATALIKNTVIAMSTIQSEIERATTQNNWILAGYILALVIAAAMTFLSWRAGNRVQDLVRRDADARIKEADSRAATALENAGSANERAGLANERAQKLENDNVQLRTDLENARADAQSQIENARAEADTKIEQTRAEAARQVGEVQKDVARQQERAANAERELAAVKKQQAPREIPVDVFVRALKAKLDTPNHVWFGLAHVWYEPGNPETYDFAVKIKSAMTASGLFSVNEEPSPVPEEPAPVMMGHIPPLIRRGAGPGITLEGGRSHSVDALIFAFNESGFSVRESKIKGTRNGDTLFVVVGPKP